MTRSPTPASTRVRLSEQVARQLAQAVRSGQLAPGARLPTEAQLVAQYGVSRTVVREALSRLKSQALVQSRQGSGVFVNALVGFEPLQFHAHYADSRTAVIQMVEVRRALDAEAAALAAERRSPTQLRRIQSAARALQRAVHRGQDGVDEDIQFHRSIADASNNPFLISTLDYLAQFLRNAMRVTRANEAHNAEFLSQVDAEHAAVIAAVAQRDPAGARASASAHLHQAVHRIRQAKADFWQTQGEQLARPLVGLDTGRAAAAQASRPRRPQR